MGKFVDLTGQKFGRLTVIERADNKCKRTMWVCKCECGNTVTVDSWSLRSEHTTSCGCYNSECSKMRNSKHGHRHDRIYNIWCHIKTRCYNKSCSSYSDYGGRGISICKEWMNDFQVFYDWSMANGYADNLTIDRIDVNGNYEPNNCRWTTKKVQANNRRSNNLITYNGKTQTLAQWANELKIDYKKLHLRICRYHWTIEKAFNTP